MKYLKYLALLPILLSLELYGMVSIYNDTQFSVELVDKKKQNVIFTLAPGSSNSFNLDEIAVSEDNKPSKYIFFRSAGISFCYNYYTLASISGTPKELHIKTKLKFRVDPIIYK